MFFGSVKTLLRNKIDKKKDKIKKIKFVVGKKNKSVIITAQKNKV